MNKTENQMIVAASENIPGAWVVERIDDDGGIEQAVFIGPLARDRAFEYANLKKKSSYLSIAAVTCRNCDTILEYVNSYVKSRQYTYCGKPETGDFITCPKCLHLVEIS